jgi:hypothetical protein
MPERLPSLGLVMLIQLSLALSNIKQCACQHQPVGSERLGGAGKASLKKWSG